MILSTASRPYEKTHTYLFVGGQIFERRSPADRKGATVRHLAVIARAESQKLHLVAVTLDGRRIYFTTYGHDDYSGGSQNKRPTTLRAVICRKAPSAPLAASSRGGTTSNRQNPPPTHTFTILAVQDSKLA